MPEPEPKKEVKITKDGRATSPSGLKGKYQQGGEPENDHSVWVWNEKTGRLEEVPRR